MLRTMATIQLGGRVHEATDAAEAVAMFRDHRHPHPAQGEHPRGEGAPRIHGGR
jgi:hypothetical protein